MNALETYLTNKKMNDSEFSRVSGIKQPTIWRIKNGHCKPSPGIALRIEEATGGAVTLRELLFPAEQSGASPANASTSADDVNPRT